MAVRYENDNTVAYEMGKACRNILIDEIKKYDSTFSPPKWAVNNMSYLVGEVLKHDPQFTEKHPMFLEAVGMSALNYCSVENFENSGNLYKVSHYAKDILKQGFEPLVDAYTRAIDKATDILSEKADNVKESFEAMQNEVKWASDYVFSKDFTDDLKKDVNEAKSEFKNNLVNKWQDLMEDVGYTIKDIRKGMNDFGKDLKPYFQKFAVADTIKDKIRIIKETSAVDNEASLEMARHLRDRVAKDKGYISKADETPIKEDTSTFVGILKKGISEIKSSIDNYRDAADRLSFEADKITVFLARDIGSAIKETAKDVYDLAKQKAQNLTHKQSYEHIR